MLRGGEGSPLPYCRLTTGDRNGMMRKRGNAPEKHEKELYLIMMYPNATHGLERVYQSQVIALVAAVLMIIPVINILAAIALIVSLVLYMIGINEAGRTTKATRPPLP